MSFFIIIGVSFKKKILVKGKKVFIQSRLKETPNANFYMNNNLEAFRSVLHKEIKSNWIIFTILQKFSYF